MTWWWLLVLGLQAVVPTDASGRCAPELAGLDRARAAAFASADPDRLNQVYAARSPLMTVDARTIADYQARGGRVVGALMRIAACEEVERTDATIRLDVVDALGQAVVRWDDGRITVLPRDRPTRRSVTLRLTDRGWRISGSQQPAPTPDQER